jgi:HNH endonuclease
LNADLIRQVWQRAQARREYCRLPSDLYPPPFQIDHIIAKQHGGRTVADNLALACIHCNRFKGPNIAGIDPGSGKIVRLFHPRRDIWSEHFVWEGPRLEALTSIGRATIALLLVNDSEVVTIRKALQEEGIFEK